jgi:hypothetical protein
MGRDERVVMLVDRDGVISYGAVTADIENLTCLAAAVLMAHTDEAGRCTRCSGATFPCLAAQLAQHAVTLRQTVGQVYC